MQGMYVNAQAQVTLVARSGNEEDTFVILTSEDHEDVATTSQKGIVKFGDVQGLYNGVDAIQWDNGETWRRIQMSATQFRMLTHRPYIPMTFLTFSILKAAMQRIFVVVSKFKNWGRDVH